MTFVNDIRQVVRRLMRSPMFTTVTLLTIAIGVGANSAVFSVVNSVLLKPLPYPNAGALIAVWQTAPRLKIKDLSASPSDYFTFREENRTFQQFGVWTGGSAAVTGQAAPEQVRCLYVTEGTLNALGVQSALGRWFTTADDNPGSAETVILTDGYWQRKFGGNPAAVGGQLVIDGKPMGVAGVMPKSFRFLDEKPDLILPFRFDRPKVHLGNFSYRGIARLKPGVTLAQANADVARMIPIVNRKFPPPGGFSAKMFEEAGMQAAVRPLKDDVVGEAPDLETGRDGVPSPSHGIVPFLPGCTIRHCHRGNRASGGAAILSNGDARKRPGMRSGSQVPESSGKRVLGIIPNYRTYPSLATYEPITSKEKLKIAVDDSFDQGTVALAVAFAGLGLGTKSNPSLGVGVAGYPLSVLASLFPPTGEGSAASFKIFKYALLHRLGTVSFSAS